MADEELEALRKQRLAELQAKHGDPSGDPAQQEAKQRESEMRNSILAQVLDQAARARLSNLALVKPEKAKAVENYLIQMARFGQLGGKVSEQGLIEILEKVSQQTEKKTTVKVSFFSKGNVNLVQTCFETMQKNKRLRPTIVAAHI
uniref:Programmed cell death protein 5 n=1 Tax=Gopherus agassizii TaxID=38772 RepID=A0A452HKE0_9SAUR